MTRSSIHSGTSGALLLLVLAQLASPALAADPVETEARARFQEGVRAYDLGEFEKALAAYTEAYRLKPLPAFLFNLGQCHRQLGNWERAAFFYRRYLDLERKPKNLATTRELLAEMEQKQQQQAREEEEAAERAKAQARLEPPPVLVVPTPTDSLQATEGLGVARKETVPITRRWWFWTGLGVLAAGAVTAGVVLSRPSPRGTTLEEINAR